MKDNEEEDLGLSPEDEALEAELRRLMPTRMNVDFVEELARDHERIVETKAGKVAKAPLLMLPLLGLCAAVVCGMVFWQLRDMPAPAAGATTVSVEPVVTDPAMAPVSAPAHRPRGEFVPVETQGYLIHADTGGIVESPEGPQRTYELRYEDVDHWHNPETSTHIRIYSPRRESVVLPVQTY